MGAVHRTVGIQVVRVDHPGPGRGRAFDDPVHDRREGFGPLTVGTAGAVKHNGGAVSGPASGRRIRHVGGHHVHTRGRVAFPRRFTRLPEELSRRATASPSGPAPKMTFSGMAGASLDHLGRLPVEGISGAPPLHVGMASEIWGRLAKGEDILATAITNSCIPGVPAVLFVLLGLLEPTAYGFMVPELVPIFLPFIVGPLVVYALWFASRQRGWKWASIAASTAAVAPS